MGMCTEGQQQAGQQRTHSHREHGAGLIGGRKARKEKEKKRKACVLRQGSYRHSNCRAMNWNVIAIEYMIA
jgi:hypothetical protein